MTDHHEIYTSQAEAYEQLVSHEDYQHHIEKALGGILPLEGIEVVELGAGTGRLTCLLAPVVRRLWAFDIAHAMLGVAAHKLAQNGLHNARLAQADHRRLPLPAASADLTLSGWSICYLVDWNRQAWQPEVEQALAEMRRVTRPGGALVLLETQGTGFEAPHPPDHLLDYYAFLAEKGFAASWFRSDYEFEDPVQAEALARFFFGDALAQQVKTSASAILPECTGLWWKFN
jgi:ubiquinone/menaquinone biosynthesis C-methylase UbiE